MTPGMLLGLHLSKRRATQGRGNAMDRFWELRHPPMLCVGHGTVFGAFFKACELDMETELQAGISRYGGRSGPPSKGDQSCGENGIEDSGTTAPKPFKH